MCWTARVSRDAAAEIYFADTLAAPFVSINPLYQWNQDGRGHVISDTLRAPKEVDMRQRGQRVEEAQGHTADASVIAWARTPAQRLSQALVVFAAAVLAGPTSRI